MRRAIFSGYVLSALLLVASVTFAVGAVANVWAASFRDEHYGLYVRHANVCMVSAVAVLASCIASFLLVRRRGRRGIGGEGR
jgi:hypothetical protein